MFDLIIWRQVEFQRGKELSFLEERYEPVLLCLCVFWVDDLSDFSIQLWVWSLDRFNKVAWCHFSNLLNQIWQSIFKLLILRLNHLQLLQWPSLYHLNELVFRDTLFDHRSIFYLFCKCYPVLVLNWLLHWLHLIPQLFLKLFNLLVCSFQCHLSLSSFLFELSFFSFLGCIKFKFCTDADFINFIFSLFGFKLNEVLFAVKVKEFCFEVFTFLLLDLFVHFKSAETFTVGLPELHVFLPLLKHSI